MTLLSRLGLAARVSSCLRRPGHRRYGSAAAVAELDYGFHDDAWEAKPRTRLRVVEESDGEMVGRGVQWVIMGDPMLRRHLYAQRLAKLLDIPYISMGSLVRQELNPSSPLYKKIASAVNDGKLVPEDVIFSLLSKRLEEGNCRGETGFILDGIPRTTMQAEILDEVAEIDLVLNLKCAEESVMKQPLSKTGSFSPSEFHSIATASGINLSLNLQTSRAQASNANMDAIWKEKLRMYAEQRKPLEEYYKQRKKLFNFHVSNAPGDTWQGLLAALRLTHMTSPQKLTLGQPNL